MASEEFTWLKPHIIIMAQDAQVVKHAYMSMHQEFSDLHGIGIVTKGFMQLKVYYGTGSGPHNYRLDFY